MKTDCSITQVRQLNAGELKGEARARAAAHLLACEKCRAGERELADERARLLSDVPFEMFASGVAERLARREPARPSRLLRYAPLLAAACVLVVALPVALRKRADPAYDGIKGGALAHLYVKDARGAHAWVNAEAVPESADIYAELTDGKFAAVVLLEGGQRHPLYAGPVVHQDGKHHVVSFGWTGAHGARLVVAVSQEPIEVATLPLVPTEKIQLQTFDLPRAH